MILGLLGKTNVGKSTFFKAATLANVEISNRPFVTIKPNHGIGFVRIDCLDKEFKTQCMPRTGYCIQHQRFVPIDLMDVAGLVEGASQGKGLGNQFLDDLRQADCFIHIVDVSGTTDKEGKTTKGYNPVQDVTMLENELDLWYLGILKKVWKTFARTVQNTKENFARAVAKQFSGLKVSEDDVKRILLKLKNFNVEKPAEWTDEQLMTFAHNLRHDTKPMIIAANKIDMPESAKNLKLLKQAYPDLLIVPCSADSELALREASKAGLIEYIPGDSSFKIIKVNDKQKVALETIKKNVLEVYGNAGVQQVLNTAIFDLLKYIAVFPAGVHKLADSKGNILPDCFLVPQGSTAYDFACRIHTDLGRDFIGAIDCRSGKKVGREHVLKNRDGIEILTK